MSLPLIAALSLFALLPAAAAEIPDAQVAAQGRPVSLQSLRGGHAAVIVFWRSDCAPCMAELKHLAVLRQQARPLVLLLVNLQSSEELKEAVPAAARFLQAPLSWQALDPPAQVLVAFGGRPPRLPLSVMLGENGQVRARRLGALGPLLVKEWKEQQ